MVSHSTNIIPFMTTDIFVCTLVEKKVSFTVTLASRFQIAVKPSAANLIAVLPSVSQLPEGEENNNATKTWS